MTVTPAWPEEVFGFPVVKSPIGAAGTLEHVTNIVLHTTEGPEDGDPRPTFDQRGDAPHFAISAQNGGTIWQLRSLDQWAAALRHSPSAPESPNAHALQIEICGFTGGDRTTPTKQWLPTSVVLERLAAVVAYMSEYHSVPLVVPNPAWKDDCSDMHLPWAANNSRRQWAATSNHWPNVRGVWAHVEVPWQDPTWHFDCGAMGRTKIIDMATALLVPTPPPGGDDELTDAQAAMLAHQETLIREEAKRHGLSLAAGSPWIADLAKIRAAAARETLGALPGKPTPIPNTLP